MTACRTCGRELSTVFHGGAPVVPAECTGCYIARTGSHAPVKPRTARDVFEEAIRLTVLPHDA